MNEYFSEDCLVKNDLYNTVKDLIICPKCKNIFLNPLMCSNCGETFCEKCINNKSKCEKCSKDNIIFKESLAKKQILSSLTYKCKNCFEEITQRDINSHLKLNCEHKEKEIMKTLHEIYTTKKTLKKLSNKEIQKIIDKNGKIYVIKGNFLNIILFWIIVITLGSSGVGKSSLINR